MAVVQGSGRRHHPLPRSEWPWSDMNGRPAMDQALFALPILPGTSEAARAFLRELEGPRKPQRDACARQVAVTKETWAIQPGPQGDLFAAHLAGEDTAGAFRQFAASQDEFDLWFEQRVQELTGADMSTPPPGPISEVLVDTQA